MVASFHQCFAEWVCPTRVETDIGGGNMLFCPGKLPGEADIQNKCSCCIVLKNTWTGKKSQAMDPQNTAVISRLSTTCTTNFDLLHTMLIRGPSVDWDNPDSGLIPVKDQL